MMRWKNEKLIFTFSSNKEFILGKDCKFSKLILLEIIGIEFNSKFSF